MSSGTPSSPPAASPGSGGPGRLAQVLVIVAGLVVLAVVSRNLLKPAPQPLPAYFEIPAFSLTSHEGKPFGTQQLQGRVWIAGFFFTRCPTVCPILLQRQAEVQRRTEKLGEAVQLVSISIDPEHDTPEVLRRDAAARGLVLKRWTLLTGPTAEIQRLVREGFKEYLSSGPAVSPEEVVHSVRFFLVDSKGQVRGLYDAKDDEQLERLVRDAGRLAAAGGSTPASDS